jgi:hypothetical protein
MGMARRQDDIDDVQPELGIQGSETMGDLDRPVGRYCC